MAQPMEISRLTNGLEPGEMDEPELMPAIDQEGAAAAETMKPPQWRSER